MALLYPWATKEYLLWHMTIGQIMLYIDLGLEMTGRKKPEDEKPKPLHEMSHAELKDWQAKYGDVSDG